jgi:DNA mismatch endonuclease (patch repair protein)
MTDRFSVAERSAIMAAVRTRDTAPELRVKKLLRSMRIRYSSAALDLPGKPDILLKDLRAVVFVNGCFWHGHQGCPRGSLPASNVEFWTRKISANRARDKRQERALRRMGYGVLHVWECELAHEAKLARRVIRFCARGGLDG